MEKTAEKSKFFIWTFRLVGVFLVFVLVGFAYWSIVIQRDYQITAQVSCDPSVESCYVTTCDPADDNTCPATESERTSYYKIINKNALDIYICEKSEKKFGCEPELSCADNEFKCSYTLCDSKSLADGESCSSQTSTSTSDSEETDSTSTATSTQE